MSVPYIPGLEKGVNVEGNIEINSDDLKVIGFQCDPDFRQGSIKQSNIRDLGDQAFLLHNLLTELECQDVIQKGETAGFEAIRGVRDDYGSCKRITIENQELADVLWSRIKDYITEIKIDGDPHEHHVHGPPFLMKALQIMSLCRYVPGGHFAPHFDGHFDRGPGERSLKTFMVYLNGDFTGGSTNIVNEQQTLYMDSITGKYCAEEKNILHSIEPEAGMAILFNHFRLHEGAQLRDGQKCILRTDIMYRNVDQNLSDNYAKAVGLLQQAETLENVGECMKAAEFYRKAFRLAPELEHST